MKRRGILGGMIAVVLAMMMALALGTGSVSADCLRRVALSSTSCTTDWNMGLEMKKSTPASRALASISVQS